MGYGIGIALAGICILVWLIISILQRDRLVNGMKVRKDAAVALNHFAAWSLEVDSSSQILVTTTDMATSIFGARRVIALEHQSEGGWKVTSPSAEGHIDSVGVVESLVGWLQHNAMICVKAELGQRRYGAMRAPLGRFFNSYDVDVLVPLVDRRNVLGLIGIALDRRPDSLARDLLRRFKLEATTACANVRLHRRTAYLASLSREVDLAASVELTMVPDTMEGQVGQLRWAGHYEAATRAGSDFFGVYAMESSKVMVIIGDAIGADLAGTMVSAAVKSCCDVIMDEYSDSLTPADLLRKLHGTLHRPTRPALCACFAALFDPLTNELTYANAGHLQPYQLRIGSSSSLASVLVGIGPLLGDGVADDFRNRRASYQAGDSFVFLTNGIVRCRDGEGREFGHGRLQRAMARQGDLAPHAVSANLIDEVQRFRGDQPLADDHALLVVQC